MVAPDGLVLEVDAGASALLEASAAELRDRTLWELLTPEAAERARAIFPPSKDGRLLRAEWTFRRPDGHVFPAGIVGGRIEGGRVELLLRDALRRDDEMSRERLAAIVTSSNDAIVSKTLQGVVTSWNEAAERIFGWTAAEMTGQSIRRIIPPDLQAEEDDFLARIARNERIENFETTRLHKDGHSVIIAVTVSPLHSAAGEIVGASKIARDITERRAARERLRESEQRFRTLADNISQITWMADEKGSVFWYNQRWYDYSGLTLEEMSAPDGRKRVHHPDHIDRVAVGFRRATETGEAWEDTFPLRGADGEFRWFLTRAQPIRDETGAIVRWFGTNTDVTEQKQREEQVRLLLGEVNHRSKNMLALVQAIARRTAASGGDDFVTRFMERIQALAASQDLLVSGGWRGVPLGDLVRSQLGHLKELIGARIAIDGPTVTLTASAAQALGMAFHELATNAEKYGALSNDAGRVRVQWRLEEQAGRPRRLVIAWSESGGPPVTQPARRGFGSTVLDAMARMALEAEILLTYAPEGLVWRLACDEIRAVESKPVAAQSASAKAAPSAGSRRVLLVEDEALVALDAATALEGANFTVVGPAASVKRALELLDANSCDAAVLDVNLGAETSEPIAERLRAAGLPFVVVSGYARDQQPQSFRSAPFLAKPLRAPLLVAAVERCLAKVAQG